MSKFVKALPVALAFSVVLAGTAFATPAKSAKNTKNPNQYMCSDTKDGNVSCFTRSKTGALKKLSGKTLNSIIADNKLYKQPVVYVDKKGKSSINYLASATATVLDYLFTPSASYVAPAALSSQSWWLDFSYSLDDAYWTSFESEIVSSYSSEFYSESLSTFESFESYEVSDGENDAEFTSTEVSESWSEETNTEEVSSTDADDEADDVEEADDAEADDDAEAGGNDDAEEADDAEAGGNDDAGDDGGSDDAGDSGDDGGE